MNLRSTLLDNLTALGHIDKNKSIESLRAFGEDEKKFLSLFNTPADTSFIIHSALQIDNQTIRDVFLAFVTSAEYFNKIFTSSGCLNCALEFIAPASETQSTFSKSVSDRFVNNVLISPHLTDELIESLPEGLAQRRNYILDKHHQAHIAIFLFISGINEHNSSLYTLSSCIDIASNIVRIMILVQSEAFILPSRTATGENSIKYSFHNNIFNLFKTISMRTQFDNDEKYNDQSIITENLNTLSLS